MSLYCEHCALPAKTSTVATAAAPPYAPTALCPHCPTACASSRHHGIDFVCFTPANGRDGEAGPAPRPAAQQHAGAQPRYPNGLARSACYRNKPHLDNREFRSHGVPCCSGRGQGKGVQTAAKLCGYILMWRATTLVCLGSRPCCAPALMAVMPASPRPHHSFSPGGTLSHTVGLDSYSVCLPR